jgi:hypothetical protein
MGTKHGRDDAAAGRSISGRWKRPTARSGKKRPRGGREGEIMEALVATTRPQRRHVAAQRTAAAASDNPAKMQVSKSSDRDTVGLPLALRC